MSDLSTADKVALYVGGGLLVIGVVVIGIIEMAIGAPHPVSGEGQIVHEALIPVIVRSYIILAGLLVWGLYAVYKVLAGGPPGGTGTRSGVGARGD